MPSPLLTQAGGRPNGARPAGVLRPGVHQPLLQQLQHDAATLGHWPDGKEMSSVNIILKNVPKQSLCSYICEV